MQMSLREVSKSVPRKQPLRSAGVDPERLEALGWLGFCGAAMLGAVWQAADPLQALTAALAQADRIVMS